MIAVQAVYVPADDYGDPAVIHAFWHIDSALVLSREVAAEGYYPAVDPLSSSSKALDAAVVGVRHYEVAEEARRVRRGCTGQFEAAFHCLYSCGPAWDGRGRSMPGTRRSVIAPRVHEGVLHVQ